MEGDPPVAMSKSLLESSGVRVSRVNNFVYTLERCREPVAEWRYVRVYVCIYMYIYTMHLVCIIEVPVLTAQKIGNPACAPETCVCMYIFVYVGICTRIL